MTDAPKTAQEIAREAWDTFGEIDLDDDVDGRKHARAIIKLLGVVRRIAALPPSPGVTVAEVEAMRARLAEFEALAAEAGDGGDMPCLCEYMAYDGPECPACRLRGVVAYDDDADRPQPPPSPGVTVAEVEALRAERDKYRRAIRIIHCALRVNSHVAGLSQAMDIVNCADDVVSNVETGEYSRDTLDCYDPENEDNRPLFPEWSNSSARPQPPPSLTVEEACEVVVGFTGDPNDAAYSLSRDIIAALRKAGGA